MTLKADALMMIADSPDAKPVVYNGLTTFGLLDFSTNYDDSGNGALIEKRVTTLTIVNGVLVNLRPNGRIIVGDDTYIVKEFDPRGIDDGTTLSITVALQP